MIIKKSNLPMRGCFVNGVYTEKILENINEVYLDVTSMLGTGDKILVKLHPYESRYEAYKWRDILHSGHGIKSAVREYNGVYTILIGGLDRNE